MKQAIKLFAFVTVFLFASSASVFAKEGDGQKTEKRDRLFKATGEPSTTIVDVNNITMWIRDDEFHDWLEASSWNGTFPKGTAGFIFSEGILWGGLVNDGSLPLVRVNGSTYSNGMFPGKILTDAAGNVTGTEDPKAPDVRIWRVRPDYKTADLRDDAANYLQTPAIKVTDADIADLRAQYDKDWFEWPWQKGAPYDDKNGNGRYDPGVDVPGIPGANQTVWYVCNDLNSSRSASTYGSPSIGIELQETYWAYAQTNPLGNIIFHRARLIYKGTKTTPSNARIDSMFITQWSDPDNGDYTDDFAGCDTTLSFGYIYNSSSIDHIWRDQYGLPPPAGGYVFLQGVLLKGKPSDIGQFDFKAKPGFKNLPMTVFTYFAAGSPRTDPRRGGPYEGTLQWYNLMAGFEPRPQYPVRVPLFNEKGQITKFELSGDPVAKTGDLDGRRFPPGDRRIVLSTGPFTMARGDTQEVVLALVGGLGADNLSSVTVAKFNSQFAHFAYDNGFDLPSPPPPPKVTATELDKEILLNWGSDLASVNQIENVVRKGFKFEGYNIYQFPTASARLEGATKLATFDVLNDITVVVDRVLDPQSGVIVSKPVQIGKNTGIFRYLDIKEDAVRGRPLINGQTYYFAVTAYGVNLDPNVPIHALESSPVIVGVVPQTPAPGSAYNTTFGATVSAKKTTGPSENGQLPTLTVVNPAATTGRAYTINVDSTGGTLKWIVKDGPTVKATVTNFGTAETDNPESDFDYPTVDGLYISLQRGYAIMREDSTVWISQFPLWIDNQSSFFSSDGDEPDAAFGDAILAGPRIIDFFGATRSTLKNRDLKIVEVRFNVNVTQKAYAIFRPSAANAQNTGREYQVNGFYDVPFTVWDMSNPAKPRQLACAFRDANQNGVWGPGNTEYVIVYDLPYDPTGSQFGLGFLPGGGVLSPKAAFDAPIMYWCYFGIAAGHIRNENPGTIRIRPQIRVSHGDAFTYTAPPAPTTSSVALAKAEVEKINVFPNPYYGFNAFESSRSQKYVTFNHLPDRATIRIFNLAGVLVKVIEKIPQSSPGQFVRWNLTNENNLPVASGIYIVHIDMPDIGKTKILKLGVVQEEQILRVY